MTLLSYGSEGHYCDHLAPIQDELRARGVEVEHTHQPSQEQRRSKIPLLVASRKDAMRFSVAKVMLVEHGAGQRYHRDAGGGDEPNQNVVLFLAPSQRVADNGSKIFPYAKRVAVGSPRVEYLASLPRSPEKVIMAWHWNNGIAPEGKTAWDRYQGAAYELAREYPVLGHGHPRMRGHLKRDYRKLGIDYEESWERCITQASALICDNSSIIWEACALDIPVVLVNAPWYRSREELIQWYGSEYGLRFWQYADVGPNVNSPVELRDALDQVLTDDRWKARRREARAYVYAKVEGAAKAAADEIMELL